MAFFHGESQRIPAGFGAASIGEILAPRLIRRLIERVGHRAYLQADSVEVALLVIVEIREQLFLHLGLLCLRRASRIRRRPVDTQIRG